jgi:DNA-binding Lrp family transcriptional regulator
MNNSKTDQILTFPDEPLDEKDRQILMTLRDAGTEGLGFNALVEKLQPTVSRSTVAVRIEKLLRLGYLDKKHDDRSGRSRPICLSHKTQSMFVFIDKSKELSKYLFQRLEDLKISNFDLEGLEDWFNEFREKYNAIFGMTAVVAVLYGVSAAGDLFLPLLMDDYKALFTKLAEIIKEKPNTLKAIRGLIDSKLGDNDTSLAELMKETQNTFKTR